MRKTTKQYDQMKLYLRVVCISKDHPTSSHIVCIELWFCENKCRNCICAINYLNSLFKEFSKTATLRPTDVNKTEGCSQRKLSNDCDLNVISYKNIVKQLLLHPCSR